MPRCAAAGAAAAKQTTPAPITIYLGRRVNHYALRQFIITLMAQDFLRRAAHNSHKEPTSLDGLFSLFFFPLRLPFFTERKREKGGREAVAPVCSVTSSSTASNNLIFAFSSARYMKYLYPYECEKEKYSSPNELQAAIDGNRREGRRSSYGAYADLAVPRSGGGGGGGGGGSGSSQHAASLSALASHMSHMSPLSLVSRPSALNGNGHHRPGNKNLFFSLSQVLPPPHFDKDILGRERERKEEESHQRALKRRVIMIIHRRKKMIA